MGALRDRALAGKDIEQLRSRQRIQVLLLAAHDTHEMGEQARAGRRVIDAELLRQVECNDSRRPVLVERRREIVIRHPRDELQTNRIRSLAIFEIFGVAVHVLKSCGG
jgi:hypothetical protein